MQHETAVRIATANPNSPGPRDASIWLGHWRNQMGSTMDLRLAGHDVFGTYTSASSSAGGPVTGPLKGTVSGDLITFLVLWPGGSMTAWTGQITDDETNPTIRTLWHLITDIPDPDEPLKLWKSTFAGADVFHR